MSDQSQEREGADGVSPDHLEGDRDAETIVGGISGAANSTTQQIGQFEILNLLGQGAFGAVYHARDPMLEREVAIKVPHASRIETDEMRQRFLREARAAAGLRHPHICPVYEVGEENDVPYIVMAFISGQELTSVLQRRGHFTDRQAALMVRRLALALEFAHQQGIVHRDLKPDNIMIDRDRREPVIMDFGLARRESGKESQLTQEGQLMGTPVYMPPEQARGDTEKIGPASDIYSLGVILYELLCSRRPHEGSMAEVLTQLLTSDAAPPSQHRADIAPELEAICMKAISRDVDDRYNSMLEFATQLANFLKSDDSTPASSAQSPPVTISAVDGPADHGTTESAAHAITVIQPTPRASFDPLMRPARRVLRTRSKFARAAAMTVIIVTGIALLAWWPGKTKVAPPQKNAFLVREFPGTSDPISSVELSPDNQWIAATTKGPSNLLVWHRDDKEPQIARNEGRMLLKNTFFATDSQSLVFQLASSVMQMSIPDGERTLKQPSNKPARATQLSFSRSGTLHLSHRLRGRYEISKKKFPQPVFSTVIDVPEEMSPLSRVGILPDTEVFIGVVPDSGEVHAWDLKGKLRGPKKKNVHVTEESHAILGRHGAATICLAWSEDETIAATSAADGSVILWDIPNRRELRTLDPHPSTVYSMDFSPDGKYLLTGCGSVSPRAPKAKGLRNDFSIRLWNVETGEMIATVGAHRATVTGLSFGGDSSQAASCSLDTTVCLWALPIPAQDRWHTLLDNGNLNAWAQIDGAASPSWVLNNGELSAPGGGLIYTRQTYSNFVLTLEYRLTPGANSGVMLRGLRTKNTLAASLEVQIADDIAPPNPARFFPTGTLVKGRPVKDVTAAVDQNPPGEWNHLKIECNGDHVSVFLNNVQIQDAFLNNYAATRDNLDPGFIGFESSKGRAGETAFRNIRIRELP